MCRNSVNTIIDRKDRGDYHVAASLPAALQHSAWLRITIPCMRHASGGQAYGLYLHKELPQLSISSNRSRWSNLNIMTEQGYSSARAHLTCTELPAEDLGREGQALQQLLDDRRGGERRPGHHDAGLQLRDPGPQQRVHLRADAHPGESAVCIAHSQGVDRQWPKW